MTNAEFWDFAIVLGGVAMLVGPFLPFISATTGFGSVSRSGVELTGGEAIFIVLVGAVATFLGAKRLSGDRPTGRAHWAPAAAGLVGLALGGYYYLQVDERVQAASSEFGFASVGLGLWMVIGGAITVIVCTMSAKRPAAAPEHPVEPASSDEG